MSSLPPILNVQTLPTINNMEIKTEVLDPITSSNQEVVFQIPKNGILDGGSFVSLAVRTASGVSDAFFPLQTGIHGLVKNAYLMSGSKVIASTEEYGHYQTMARLFETPEHRAYIEQIKSGTSMDRFNQNDVALGRIQPKDLAYTTFDAADTARAVVPDLVKPTDDDSTTPVFSVPLSHLIPFMRSRQLPLFAMKENIYLRLVFNTQVAAGDVGKVCCLPSGSGSSPVVVPSLFNVKFYSDHLYYLDGSMEQTQSAIFSDNGLSYLFEDSILTNAQIPAVANPTAPAITEQRFERDIAVSGRVVRSLLLQEKPSGEKHPVCGDYISKCMTTDDSLNYRINEQRIYDRDLTTPSQKYNELTNVMGKPLQVPSQLYSFDSDSSKARADRQLDQNSVYIGQIEGHQLPSATATLAAQRTTDIRGINHYTGIDLTTSGMNVLGNGRRIGVKPIIVQKTELRPVGFEGAREMRCWASVERTITIKDGTVMLSA